MARLIYSAITSLDLYVADADGNFDWAMPDADVHAFVNDLERPVGTYLYGRRMYEVMSTWQTMPESKHDVLNDYATIWRAADKVVYSTTLSEVNAPRTRLERVFDPTAVRHLKEQTAQPISIGGPTLAARALRAGLVDQIGLFINPVIVGAGNRAVPADVHISLKLRNQHRFANGVVYVEYDVGRDVPCSVACHC